MQSGRSPICLHGQVAPNQVVLSVVGDPISALSDCEQG